MMESLWAELRADGRTPRTREEIDAEIDALRNDAEEEMQAVERLQEDCCRAREQSQGAKQGQRALIGNPGNLQGGALPGLRVYLHRCGFQDNVARGGSNVVDSRRVSLDEVVVHFQDLEDPRSTINQRHPLVSVVVIALLAVLAGAGGPTAIEPNPSIPVPPSVGLAHLARGTRTQGTRCAQFSSTGASFQVVRRIVCWTDLV